MAVSPHPHIPALQRGKRDSSPQNLSDWATSILAFHQSPKAVLEWQISSVQWFKNKTGLEHEYPIFTLRNESNPSTEIYLRFDRSSSAEALECRKEEIVVSRDVYSDLTSEQRKKITVAIKQEKRSLVRRHLKGIVHMSKASSRKDNGFQPEDTVMRCRQSNGTDNRNSDKAELLVTYSNFSRPFPLRDLAIIAQSIVTSADAYLVLVQQCYWFTRTMVGICVAHYRPQPEGGIKNISRDRSGRINRLTFVPIINEDNPDEIGKFLNDVRQDIAKDDSEVQARYMNGEGGRKQAEVERAAAEERTVTAENARIIAENARVAAEKARAQAENRVRELEERLAAGLHSSSTSV